LGAVNFQEKEKKQANFQGKKIKQPGPPLRGRGTPASILPASAVSEQETCEKAVKTFALQPRRDRDCLLRGCVLFPLSAALAFCCRRAAKPFLLAAIRFFYRCDRVFFRGSAGADSWCGDAVVTEKAANGYFASSSPRRNSYRSIAATTPMAPSSRGSVR